MKKSTIIIKLTCWLLLFSILFTPFTFTATVWAQEPVTPTEVISLRTETSSTYDLGNGNMRLEISTVPTHYKDNYADPKELWKDIDLTQDANGNITKAPYTLTIKDGTCTLTSKRDGSRAVITPSKIGDMVAKASNFTIIPFNSGIKLQRVIASKDDPMTNEFNLSMVGKGVTVISRAVDADGEPVPVLSSLVGGKLTEAIDTSKVSLNSLKYPVTIDPTLTVQPSNKDAWISSSAPTTNYGSNTFLRLNDDSASVRRAILEFDISGLPVGATIGDPTTLNLYYYYRGSAAAVGKTVWAYKLIRNDWVEAQATWNIYKTSSNWTAPGGDYVTSGPAGGSTVVPGSYTWMVWDAKAIVANAYSIPWSVAEFLVKFEGEAAASPTVIDFYSREYTDDTSLCPKLIINYSVGGIVAPTVISNNSSSVEETTAILSGNITDTGGENCTDRGFLYDTDSGFPYASNSTESGDFGTGVFSANLTSLTEGELYYWVAGANNTAGWGYGSELTFLTKPLVPTGFTATKGDEKVDLAWTKGTGADNTTVYAKKDSYPTGRDDAGATLIYDNTGTSYSHIGLTNGDNWFYRAWSWCTEGGLEQYSDDYASANATPSVIPTVTSENSTAVEETTATLSGNITDTGGLDITYRGFHWGITSGVYPDHLFESGNFTTGVFSANITALTEGELYYWEAMAKNDTGWGYGAELTFITKPNPATSFNSTDNGTTWVFLEWINGTGMDYVEIRSSDNGTAPSSTDNTSGTFQFWGTGTSANITGLTDNTTYHFTIYTYATEGGLWSMADNNPSCQDTTDAYTAPSVTMDATTGITNNSAQLNATITDDGWLSCNATWYWGTTDEGTAPTWAFSHNVTGLSAGAILYTISGTLTPGTLYYGNIYVVNAIGNDWGVSVNWTTSNITAIYPPDPFTLTDLGSTTVEGAWTPDATATYTMIRISRSGYPSSITDGELFYYGAALGYNGTGYDLEYTTYYGSAWGFAADNTTHSADYTTASIGGATMLFFALAILPLGLTATMFATRQMMLGFPCAIFWAVFGGHCYTQSTATWDIYYFLFIASVLGMVIFTAFAAFALRTRREEAIEGDLYFDEGGDKDVKFIDEGDESSKTGSDDEKPSRRTREIRDRASKRRSRWG